MAVFEFDATHHVGNLVNGSERGRPVGNGKPGVVAGDQGSSDDQKKRGARGKDSEGVVGAIVRFGQGVQSLILNPTLLTGTGQNPSQRAVTTGF